MSDDKGSPQRVTAGDEKSANGTETEAFRESLRRGTSSSNVQEALPAGAVGGVQEALPAGAAGSAQEECTASETGNVQLALPTIATGGVQLEAPAGATGGSHEDSASGGNVPNPAVILGIEDVQQAFRSNTRNQISQFQSMKNDLLRTIRDLEQTARRNQGNWEIYERLRENINETNAFLHEIIEAMSMQETRNQYMNLQINQFFERRREGGENYEGTTIRAGTVGGVDVSIDTAGRACGEQEGDNASAKDYVDKCKIALALVDQMLQDAGLSCSTGEMVEDGAIEMEATTAAEEPVVVEAAVEITEEEPGIMEGGAGRAEEELSMMEGGTGRAEEELSMMEGGTGRAEEELSMMEGGTGRAEEELSMMEGGTGRAEEELSMMEGGTGRAEEGPSIMEEGLGIAVDKLEVGAEVNVAEEGENDDGLQLPVVTGKYTLAIRAHQLYSESSSSDDSQEPDLYHQDAEGDAPRQLQPRDDDAMEEGLVEDDLDDSSSDSPEDDSRRP